MDLKDAFHQVPLHPLSRPYTCTSTPIGTKQWCVVVMGLKNGVSIFQRVVEWCLREVDDIASPYVDDILSATEGQGTWEETLYAHDRDIRLVLTKMFENKLVADVNKCNFFVQEVEFCGHILGRGKRRPAPGKLVAIANWEEPKTITALRGFLGFTNYYSSYVEGYAHHVGILQELLKVGRKDGKAGSQRPVTFGPREKEAFQAIKDKLQGQLELYTLSPDRPFVLRVDASGWAVGAALEQFIEPQEGMPTQDEVKRLKRVPVAFCSRKLTSNQLNWTPREKETYAIILALEKWASWIGFQPVLVLTDHKSLENWVTEQLDTPSGPVGRRARWHEFLSRFDLSVEYIKGQDNVVADALSRWAYPASKGIQDISIHGNEVDDQEMRALIEQERKEERQCSVLWVNEVMIRLDGALTQQLTEAEGAGIEGDHEKIAYFRSVIAKVKATKKDRQAKESENPPTPKRQTPAKMKGGLQMFLEAQARKSREDQSPPVTSLSMINDQVVGEPSSNTSTINDQEVGETECNDQEVGETECNDQEVGEPVVGEICSGEHSKYPSTRF